jgi:hypothetical protein
MGNEAALQLKIAKEEDKKGKIISLPLSDDYPHLQFVLFNK